MLHDFIVNTLLFASIGMIFFLLFLFFKSMVDLQDYKNCNYDLETYRDYVERRDKRGYFGTMFTQNYLQTFNDLAEDKEDTE